MFEYLFQPPIVGMLGYIKHSYSPFKEKDTVKIAQNKLGKIQWLTCLRIAGAMLSTTTTARPGSYMEHIKRYVGVPT